MACVFSSHCHLLHFLFSYFKEIKTQKVLLCNWYPHPKEKKNRYTRYSTLANVSPLSFIVPLLISQESTVSECCLSDSVEINVGPFSISLIFLTSFMTTLHLFCIQEQEPINNYTSDQILTCGVLNQSTPIKLIVKSA